MMHNFRFFFIFLCSLALCHANWTTSTPEPISNTYSFTYASVFNSSDSISGVSLATWVDSNNNDSPTYSLYTPGSGWSPINTISNTSQALFATNVFASSDPQSGIFLASWSDANLLTPTVSIYSPGSGWSSADSFTASSATVNTFSSFDSSTGQFLITWADDSNIPHYAFYDPNTGWGVNGAITGSSLAANVYTSYDSSINQFLAVWVDVSTGQPMYSFYSSGLWSAALPISTLADVDNDVLCSYNPITGQFIATWADINQNLYPFYSIYTPSTGWSSIETITTSSGVIDNVATSCDLSTGQFLATWSNVTNGIPTYSFYTPGSGWSQPGVISTLSASGSDIVTSFDSRTGQFLATWADRSNPNLLFNPTFSLFTYALLPPTNFSGSVVRNRFLGQTEYLHRLVWTPPTDSLLIVSYQISRNGILIATLPSSGPSVYYDDNRAKNSKDTYTIVSVDANGSKSTPLYFNF